jgi:hypothetical protein
VKNASLQQYQNSRDKTSLIGIKSKLCVNSKGNTVKMIPCTTTKGFWESVGVPDKHGCAVIKVGFGYKQSDTLDYDSDQEDRDVVDETQKDDSFESPPTKDTRNQKEKRSASRSHDSDAEKFANTIYSEQGSPYYHGLNDRMYNAVRNKAEVEDDWRNKYSLQGDSWPNLAALFQSGNYPMQFNGEVPKRLAYAPVGEKPPPAKVVEQKTMAGALGDFASSLMSTLKQTDTSA